MRDLVPSGRFAQLARLSRKALRLYAESGLLRPAHIGEGNGYRYYHLDQLDEAHRIARLRELGMPLDAVQEAVRAWHSPELRAHLEQHRERLRQQAEQVQAALAALDTLLAVPPQAYPVALRPVAPQSYLGIRAWCAPDDACAAIGAAQRRLYGLLGEARLTPAGASFARYHAEEEEAWDVEVGVPVSKPGTLTWPADVQSGELPGGMLAATVHAGACGGNQGLQGAYAAVWRWVREHGHETQGGPLEVYLADEHTTPDVSAHRTKVAWMVRPS